MTDPAAHYEATLGRRMTEIERAAVVEQDAIIARREAGHAAWLAGLSRKRRRAMGLADTHPNRNAEASP